MGALSSLISSTKEQNCVIVNEEISNLPVLAIEVTRNTSIANIALPLRWHPHTRFYITRAVILSIMAKLSYTIVKNSN